MSDLTQDELSYYKALCDVSNAPWSRETVVGNVPLMREADDLQSRLTAAEARVKELDLLARRAYPDLKNSGICSAHCESGHYECELCYPDWSKLLEAHMRVKDNLRAELYKLKGTK